MISLLACFTLLSFAARVDFVDAALPCNSPLRTRYPQSFSHCPKCSYTQWTTWSAVIPVQIKNEPACDSNKAKKYERTRTPLAGAVCEDALQKNTTYKCVPTLRQQAELFIRSLRLGTNADEPTDNPTTQSTPQTTRPPTTRPPSQTTRSPTQTGWFRFAGRYRPTTRSPIWTTRPPPQFPIPAGSDYCPSLTEQANNRICHNVCPRGKRSVEEESPIESLQANLQSVAEKTDIPVLPFNMEEVVSDIHARRRRQVCPNSDTQPTQDPIRYVLFILDTSGSIGNASFQDVKQILADISATLCDNLRVALLTFGHEFNLEFCFKCYNNRNDIFGAIRNTVYRHGSSTRTTAATRCACQTMLTTECGLPQGVHTPNIDVVYLTDGQHNGHCTGTTLADELDCFHSDTRLNINTYAIGIGRASLDSVHAMAKVRDPDDAHVFNVDTFADLKVLFALILDLLSSDSDGDGVPDYSCISHDATPCER